VTALFLAAFTLGALNLISVRESFSLAPEGLEFTVIFTLLDPPIEEVVNEVATLLEVFAPAPVALKYSNLTRLPVVSFLPTTPSPK
jgi:hypothetical protein